MTKKRIVLVVFAIVIVFVIIQRNTSDNKLANGYAYESDWADRAETPTNDQVTLAVTSVNGGTANLTLTNNSPDTIYYLTGCGAITPMVFELKTNTLYRVKGAPQTCQSLPMPTSVASGRSATFSWQPTRGVTVDGPVEFEIVYSTSSDTERSGNEYIARTDLIEL